MSGKTLIYASGNDVGILPDISGRIRERKQQTCDFHHTKIGDLLLKDQ
jgi:hypothetical protein